MIRTLAGVSLRALLTRRRTIVLVLFALAPVLLALLLRVAGEALEAEDLAIGLFDGLLVRTVLPLVALVFGTAALGSELEDGTAVYLLAKPIDRWRIVVAKLIVAGGLTAILMTASAVLSGLVLVAGRGDVAIVGSFAVAVVVGSFVYAAAFLALSLVTTRALVLGLAYTFIWEGVVSSLLEGARTLSVRAYTSAIADAIGDFGGDTMAPSTAVILALIVFGGSLAIATRRLARHEVRSSDSG